MEIVKREAVPEDFRIRQLRARDLLRGDLAGADLEAHVEQSVMTTRSSEPSTGPARTRFGRPPSAWPAARSR